MGYWVKTVSPFKNSSMDICERGEALLVGTEYARRSALDAVVVLDARARMYAFRCSVDISLKAGTGEEEDEDMLPGRTSALELEEEVNCDLESAESRSAAPEDDAPLSVSKADTLPDSATVCCDNLST